MRIIAQALIHVITRQLDNTGVRQFFRIDGFDSAVYVDLLRDLEAAGQRIGDYELLIHSTGPIEGYPHVQVDPDKSATWYRNHVGPQQALILLFNQPTSDAQSLKDLYSITESSLAHEWLDPLIEASFRTYRLDSAAKQTIRDFLTSFERATHSRPQLRDLVDFLDQTHGLLAKAPELTLSEALADSLPAFRLFRCARLAKLSDRTKATRLLRTVAQAAAIGSEVLESSQLKAYLEKLNNIELRDDTPQGGLDPATKTALLERFLTHDRSDDHRQVFTLDWDEVEPILGKATRTTKRKGEQVSQAIIQELKESGIDAEHMPAGVRATVEALAENAPIEDQDVEQLLAEYEDILQPPTRKKLKSLQRRKTFKHTDFLVALLQALVSTITRSESPEPARFQVTAMPPEEAKDSRGRTSLLLALQAFQTLYGGIDKALPSLAWDLRALAQARAEYSRADHEEDGDYGQSVALAFTLQQLTDDGSPKPVADIVWTVDHDGPAILTLLNIQAEHGRIESASVPPSLPLPLYRATREAEIAGDVDLYRPLRTVGAWYAEPGDLRTALLAELTPTTQPEDLAKVERAVRRMEYTWARFINHAAEQGLLSAPLDQLLNSYERLIEDVGAVLRAEQSHRPALLLLNQAWLILPESGDWAIVPFVHPLKLQWWRSRVAAFETLIARLLAPESRIADPARLLQEIATAYGSTNTPAMLALTRKDRTRTYLLPVHELAGYELFRIDSQATIAHGLDPELASSDESDLAVKQAAIHLAALVEDYLETYPFARNGLEIYLINCRNGALPGLLIEQIQARLTRRQEISRLSVIVPTKRGMAVYNRVLAWLDAHEEYRERRDESFFPRMSLKVRDYSTFEELMASIGDEDTDMVILPDVIAEEGQTVTMTEAPGLPLPPQTQNPLFLQLYAVGQMPHKQESSDRYLPLTPQEPPSLHLAFYRLQQAIHERKQLPQHPVRAELQVSLERWKDTLRELHERFNWVVCYDTVVDRFLLEKSLPDHAKVIRYSLGLGPKRRHLLTVSAANKTRSIVANRLARRLESLFGALGGRDQPAALAEAIIKRANRISGDIVLRAAGPGSFLNELLGMVATAQGMEQSAPQTLSTWIYLEDFAQWFRRRMPDLLYVAITETPSGRPRLTIHVIETKCVGAASLAKETREAQEQAIIGLKRLAEVWAPGAHHLDAAYWYDQLYQALAGTITLEAEHYPLWERLRRLLPHGEFELALHAHAWVFGHDDPLDMGRQLQKLHAPIHDLDAVITTHLGGRDTLRRLLEGTLPAPAPAHLSSALSSLDAAAAPTPSVAASPILPEPAPIEFSAPVLPVSLSTTLAAPTPEPPATQSAPPAAPHTPEAPATQPDSELADWIKAKGDEITRALRHYNISVRPLDVAESDIGPSLVRFKLRPRPGQQLSKIQRVGVDLQRELALTAPPLIDNVPGQNYIGLDVPRPKPETIELLRTLGELPPPQLGRLNIIAGLTPNGELIMPDLATMPHMLVAGTTGAGKTVFLYSLIVSLISQFGPDALELLLVDPKQTDFVFFDNLPHLVGGHIILEPEAAITRLQQLTSEELEQRTQILNEARIRDIGAYNAANPASPMRPIVVVIDEYADLVQVLEKADRQAFELQLSRLAQRARNVGIHLVIATQRPSADILTTRLKTNLPARVAFRLPSHHDSQIIIDQPGAENLIGKGDMLFLNEGHKRRLQGLFVHHQDLEAWVASQPWLRHA